MIKGLTTILLACFQLLALAQNDSGYNQTKTRVKNLLVADKADTSSVNFKPQKIRNNAFKPGEKLEYEMRYGFVVGGRASGTLVEKELNGKTVYHAVAQAHTVGLADVMFGVKDQYESYFDPETNLPEKSVRNIKEGGYKFYNEVDYYHDEGKVYSHRSKKYKKVGSGLLDLVGAFYHARRVLFPKVGEINDTVLIKTYFEDKLYHLRVVYKGKETVKVEAGKIRCLKFNPLVEAGRVFDTEDGVTFWVSDDPNYVLVRAQMNLFIGSFKGDLVKYTGLKHPLAIVK